MRYTYRCMHLSYMSSNIFNCSSLCVSCIRTWYIIHIHVIYASIYEYIPVIHELQYIQLRLSWGDDADRNAGMCVSYVTTCCSMHLSCNAMCCSMHVSYVATCCLLYVATCCSSCLVICCGSLQHRQSRGLWCKYAYAKAYICCKVSQLTCRKVLQLFLMGAVALYRGCLTGLR
jgi:hypothetical protein